MKLLSHALTSVLSLLLMAPHAQAQYGDSLSDDGGSPRPNPPTEASSSPAPETDPTPFELPTLRPIAEPTPVATPSPTATVRPSPSATPNTATGQRPELSYTFGSLQEGKRVPLTLKLDNASQMSASSFPIRGTISYQDVPYNHSQAVARKVTFQIDATGQTVVPLLFQSPGRKKLEIRTQTQPGAVRNPMVFVAPFPATTFPLPTDTSRFSRKPDDWRVWVNLQTSDTQRQYYMVTFQDEIVQKLLTSSATPDKVTPLGSFKLGPKAESPKSTIYESVMPFWTTILVPGFSFEYGNHGLVGESYLYYLGTPASHGCLRLSNKWVRQGSDWVNIGGARWVFNHVPVGTPIQIFRAPVSPFSFENYRQWLQKQSR